MDQNLNSPANDIIPQDGSSMLSPQIPILAPAVQNKPKHEFVEESSQPEVSSPTEDTDNKGGSILSPQLQLLALSFLALFLELMFIRWVPSTIRLVSYFSNLMLISSFLGLGLGAMASARGFKLFRRFPYALLFGITFFFVFRNTAIGGGGGELRFFAGSSELLSYLVLVGAFISNALIFMPIGERIGQLFNQMPVLPAYSWDLGGSLLGTLCFGFFSFFAFSPLLGIVGAMGIYLLVSGRSNFRRSIVPLVAATMLLWMTLEPQAIWSPYYYITVHADSEEEPLDPATVPTDVRTQKNPPRYTVRVNHHFYQPHETIDPSRFEPGTLAAVRAARQRSNYTIPYQFKTDPSRVAIVGAGGGVDVEAALLESDAEIDAIEIDPKLVALSRRISPNGAYDNPRVNVRIDDARAFLQRTKETYDLIVFGYLDSQALFSSFSSIRLDGYVYTVESLRAAFSHLNEHGVISLSFYVADQHWLTNKLSAMVQEAVGQAPLIYYDGGRMTLIVQRTPRNDPPQQLNTYELQTTSPNETMAWSGAVPSDDWPYLYLKKRSVPTDYLIVIATLLAFSIGGVMALRSSKNGVRDLHFFFLGMAFLLLQTNSITQCTLYFGATWFVTTIIVAGVLLMVLLANVTAIRFFKTYTHWLYVPLFLSLAVLCFTPTTLILELPFVGRLVWALLVVPLPIFFAGLAFSTTFRHAKRPSSSLGANLIGATTGGFIEYGGMAIGHNSLFYVVMAAYGASLLVLLCTKSDQ